MIAERDRRGVVDDAGEVAGRDFGRDGVSGLVTIDRAMRARDVSRPGLADEEFAWEIVDSLIARAEGRRQRVS